MEYLQAITVKKLKGLKQNKFMDQGQSIYGINLTGTYRKLSKLHI